MNDSGPGSAAGRELEALLATSEGLRQVLAMIHAEGPGGWRRLPAGTVLLQFAQRKYAPIAKSWGRSPEDAAYAAFIAMQAPSLIEKDEPWAVITQAVRLSIIADTQAERLLISPERARRPENRPDEIPLQAGDDREYLYDLTVPVPATGTGEEAEPFAREAAAFLAVAGWPADFALTVVEYVSLRTAEMGSRESALDALQRDEVARGQFGVDPVRWAALLGLMIGTRRGPAGLLVRFILGDTLSDALADPTLAPLTRRVAW